VLADDGEKFGGWPGTFEWVYQKGWLREFLVTLEELSGAGEIRLVTLSQALAEVPAMGPAYLPTASYREMETWALPAASARRLLALESELGPERIAGPEGSLVRGSHWRNFLSKYPEANRMHKKMLALSSLCRERGDPPRARRAIGRAQCNDVYWHGVFGGLYLPHLRAAIWRALAAAEAEIRREEPLGWEARDLDHDGAAELCVHSALGSAVISPRRGGGLEELIGFAALTNYAGALTRRREAYHEAEDPAPVDRETRAVFQERVWPAALTVEALVRGDAPLASWATVPATWEAREDAGALSFRLDLGGLVKTFRFHPDGRLELTLAWEPDPAWPAGAWFTSELSLARPLAVEAARAVEWRYPIETVAKSEKGLDHTVQGESLTLGWPATACAARVTLDFPA